MGYLPLIKNNTGFRRLWYGQIVSELGDWLNSIAIYALILQVSGSGMAMAAAMMAKLLPMVVVSPFAGVVIDRMNRKTVMIVADVLRFFIVLGFLFVHERGDLWLLYTLVILEVAMSGFFEPARSAIIPSITAKKDLVTANALSGSTWSVMLAFGSALGGVLVSWLGIQAAFLVDAMTFLLSAWFIFRIPTPQESSEVRSARIPGQGGVRDMMDGFRYILSEPIVLVLTLLKSGLGIAGGIMTLIPLYAHKLMSTPSAISMGIGLMYASRGLGAAVGPILVSRLFGDSSRVLQGAIFFSFFLQVLAYLLYAGSHSLWSACLSIGLATLFGSVIWVFSTSLIHMEAEERFLGRVFSSEMALLTLVMGISNWAVGYSVDHFELTPNAVTFWMAMLYVAPGFLWGGFLLFVRNRFQQGKPVGSVFPVDPSGFNPCFIPPAEQDAPLAPK